MWNNLCAKITDPFITKYGTPLAPITKYGTVYVPRPYTHLLRNMEPLLPLLLNIWNSLCAKITHPFITKYGTPLAPITKYGTAYVPRSHTHSLRNMEALMTPSQNAETLMS